MGPNLTLYPRFSSIEKITEVSQTIITLYELWRGFDEKKEIPGELFGQVNFFKKLNAVCLDNYLKLNCSFSRKSKSLNKVVFFDVMSNDRSYDVILYP